MKFPRDLDADEIIKALIRLGFVLKSQKGSHLKLVRASHTVIVPNHSPVKVGTLKEVLAQAHVTLDELLDNL